LIAYIGAIITAAYSARMVILTFFGEVKTAVSQQPGKLMTIPLLVLAFFSLFAGFIELPHNLAHFTLFSTFLETVLPLTVLKKGLPNELIFQLLAIVATLAGIFLAYYFYVKRPQQLTKLMDNKLAANVHQLWLSGWGFDKLYQVIIVKPLVFIATINKNDVIDQFYQGLTLVIVKFYKILSYTQSGSLRWYLAALVIGAIVILGLEIII
jgi:NADH-quinone oxidoreductase subunit L